MVLNVNLHLRNIHREIYIYILVVLLEGGVEKSPLFSETLITPFYVSGNLI